MTHVAPRMGSAWPPALDPALRESVVPYEAIRRAVSPDDALLAFCQTTCDAADGRKWERPALDRPRSA